MRVGTPTGPRQHPGRRDLPVLQRPLLRRPGAGRDAGGGARQIFGMPHGWESDQPAPERPQPGRRRQGAPGSARSGQGVDVETPSSAAKQVTSQLDALNVVLYFFSGIALFVGGFLILNSFSMTVLAAHPRARDAAHARRHAPDDRAHRAGRGPRCSASLGSLLGLALGLGLAAGLISLMKGVGLPVGNVQVTAIPAIVAVIVLGMAATAVGAWWPARRAGRTSPIVAAQGGRLPRRTPPPAHRHRRSRCSCPARSSAARLWFGTGRRRGAPRPCWRSCVHDGRCSSAWRSPRRASSRRSCACSRSRCGRLAPPAGAWRATPPAANPPRTAATAVALTIGLSVIVVNARSPPASSATSTTASTAPTRAT